MMMIYLQLLVRLRLLLRRHVRHLELLGDLKADPLERGPVTKNGEVDS